MNEIDHFEPASIVPALQATILHFPGKGPTVSLLLSNLNVGFWRMKVHTYSTKEGKMARG